MAAKQRRYLGVQPFKTSDSNIFFGRDEDIENLLDFLMLEKLTVLFGRSGYGKSSLLSAGIVPKLTDPERPAPFRFLPVEVRFGSYVEKINDRSPVDTIVAALEKATAGTRLLRTSLVDGNSDQARLWLHFKQRQDSCNGQFILIFDQFEEIFSYPALEQEKFRRLLAELLFSDIPENIRGRLDQVTPEERRELVRPMNIKALFAIRSDRMSQLDAMKDKFATILHKRFELLALPRSEAEKALVTPAGLGGDFESDVFRFEPEVVQKILTFLEDENGRVDPIQLQILAESFEKRAITEKIQTFHAQNMGDLKAVIARYYIDKINAIEQPEERLAARRLCEEGLAQESDPPVRLTLYEAQIRQFFNISTDLLEKLVDSRLLRAEAGAGGRATYELPHDTLLEPVLEAKRARLQEEKAEAETRARLEAEQKVLEAEARAAEEKKRADEARRLQKQAESEKNKAQRMTYFAIGLAILASMAGLGAGLLYRAAETSKNEANNQLTKALEQEKKRLAVETAAAQRALLVYQNAEDTLLIQETQQQISLLERHAYLNQLAIQHAQKQSEQ